MKPSINAARPPSTLARHMQLFDTLRRTKTLFDGEGPVRLYVCGVTPYDTTHVGHARTYVVFDVLVRHLIASGRTVRYIQNVTDVDESIIKRAAELGEPYQELGDRYTRTYLEDMSALGVLPADLYPKASEAIPYIQQLVEDLMGSDKAYRTERGVYFRIASADDYGKLSRLPRPRMGELYAEQDQAELDDPHKEDELDFALWRPAAPDEPSWPSPWGAGRPGWHIECSALALAHLGDQLDIHGGGADLVYPHHESELAQSEALTGKEPFARFWVHVGLVLLEGRKMSKSAGNMVFVRDLLGGYSGDSLRLHLLGTHYREPLDFDQEDLGAAARLADRLAEAARLPAREGEAKEVRANEAERRFLASLDDDLDTPRAIGALEELAEGILRAGGTSAGRAQRTLLRLAGRLGLRL
ncbi:MAG: cysteine--tRNA ligase [Actinomycetota bacterium]|nr:cysteine--tRNA ligase [Actinomycetota bacterium]